MNLQDAGTSSSEMQKMMEKYKEQLMRMQKAPQAPNQSPMLEIDLDNTSQIDISMEDCEEAPISPSAHHAQEAPMPPPQMQMPPMHTAPQMQMPPTQMPSMRPPMHTAPQMQMPPVQMPPTRLPMQRPPMQTPPAQMPSTRPPMQRPPMHTPPMHTAPPKPQNKPKNPLTTSLGQPLYNNSASLAVEDNGPVVLGDLDMIDKMAHFDRERIPERVVHAKGAGAMGSFVPYDNFSKYCSADFLSNPNQSTPILIRFSTVIGSKGSPDTVRDPRGFAIKFYTNDGIYDIVGLHFPVFFIRDAMKFPDFIHSLKPSPVNNCTYPERFFDFAGLSPETTHAITWLYSDKGTIKNYRTMDGFGVNTYIWVNAQGKRYFVKYHFVSQQGDADIEREEALHLAGTQPNIATQDLYDAIRRGEKVKYELCVQMLDPELEIMLPFDPLDDTKVWDTTMFPLLRVGMLTLDKNPDDFFAQVEQSAFSPSNIVPGIELSNDKMLQGRSFSYADTQRYRLGANFAQLPINRSVSPVHNHQQEGKMAIYMTSSPTNYQPNSLDSNKPPLAPEPAFKGPYTCGYIGRYTISKIDDFTQAGERYRSLTDQKKQNLIKNLAADLQYCNKEIQQRMIANFTLADKQFGETLQNILAK